jgi:hypothetical protein
MALIPVALTPLDTDKINMEFTKMLITGVLGIVISMDMLLMLAVREVLVVLLEPRGWLALLGQMVQQQLEHSVCLVVEVV